MELNDFNNLSTEDKGKEIKRAYYNNLDDILDTLYFHRALELSVFPEDEEEINNHIIEKSRELMDKYSRMGRGELTLKMMADLGLSEILGGLEHE